MSKEKVKSKPAKTKQKISLYPLDFEETLERLLQVEPEKKKDNPTEPKKRANPKSKSE